MAETTEENFAEDRLAAAKDFAHTMIVVDDEAYVSEQPEEIPVKVVAPGRGSFKAEKRDKAKVAKDKGQRLSHPMNSKLVVDRAMDLGLVCSVVQPEKKDFVINKVSKAAERADIISLDWQMNGDDGDTAKSIVRQIIQTDSKKHGRLRLIAIYTGVRDRDAIYKTILEDLPDALKLKHDIRVDGDCIVSNHGLRIVWLFKSSGIQLTGKIRHSQIKEEDLPSRLQREFSELSEGLLSNVALATIASIRDATHHVIGKFTKKTDGPYLHHRTFLENPMDAGDYAVSVVMSELKSAVNFNNIIANTVSSTAIKNRIQDLLGSPDAKRKLYSLNNENAETSQIIDVESITTMAISGWAIASNEEKIKSLGKKNIRKGFSSLFEDSFQEGKYNMLAFASLTGVRAHQNSHLHGTVPRLTLGSVIKTPEKKYLLCLQASCDSVGIGSETEFYFIPLVEKTNDPDHIVPLPQKDDQEITYLGLESEKKAYTKSVSQRFAPTKDSESQVILARKVQGKAGFYFIDTNNNQYEWIANLKQRRAMRSAQWIGQDMGRIGFDEFEPFRKNFSQNN